MKSLLKYLSPFAPDISGAVSVLFDCGGMIVICDAGGCTGNVCGFDEPRWFESQSAIFSAGLRDMDAILGRDDKLVEKLCRASVDSDAPFTALVGTPAPAIIATDFRAVKRALSEKTGRPAIAVETTGTHAYDSGMEKAMLELFKTFALEKCKVVDGSCGIIGLTPMDFGGLSPEQAAAMLEREGVSKVMLYASGGLDTIRRASSAEKNIVLTPAGIPAAKYLEEKFGTPFEIRCPFPVPAPDGLNNKRVLVIHQQVVANAVRDAVKRGSPSAEVDAASWFKMIPELMRENDLRFSDEDDFARKTKDGGYDLIIGDIRLKRALRGVETPFLDFPHFAVSGRMPDSGAFLGACK